MANEVVKFGVAPVTVVVAVVAGHETKKCVRVHVIADPCRADYVEITSLACGEVDLPLLVVKADLDAELFFPHLLDSHGDGGVRLAGVKEQLKLWKAFATGEACLSEKLASEIRIVE